MRRVLKVIGALLVLAVVAVLAFFFLPEREETVAASPSLPRGQALIDRGRYLARAADCVACHSVPGSADYAGGRPFKLPFGTIYASNITPDRETGIGAWSDADFVRALHRGVGKDGHMLYPAFPYASYALMSTDDALAIKAYLFSLPPVHASMQAASLSFPYNQRWLMRAWRLLFVPRHRFEPDPGKPEAVNRGAYLAEALGHCGECHTPRNALYGLDSGRRFAGAKTQGWKAYNITSDRVTGLGGWSDEALAAYLATGFAGGHGAASGGMGEAVDDSLRYLAPNDIAALVAYLRTVPSLSSDEPAVSTEPEAVKLSRADSPPPGEFAAEPPGLRIFEGACSSCHAWNGTGQEHEDAGLVGGRTVNDPHGTNLIQVLLHGGRLISGEDDTFMPSFAEAYSDAELAAVGNYVLAHFGGKLGLIRPIDVAAARAAQ